MARQGASCRARGRPLPVPPRFSPAAGRQDEAAGGPRRRSTSALFAKPPRRDRARAPPGTALERRTRSSRPRGWRPDCSTSKPTSSRRCGRRRARRFRTLPGRRARDLARRAAESLRPPLPRAARRIRRGRSSRSSRRSWSLRPLVPRCAASVPELAPEIRGWTSFHLPETMRLRALVETERPNPRSSRGARGPGRRRRRRDGFDADRPAHDPPRGARTRRTTASSATSGRRTPARRASSTRRPPRGRRTRSGIPLKGCPLDEKISEMHQLRREGDSIGALALVCIDNPMCPGTGHRICNDCMKGCIFQKQEPGQHPSDRDGGPDRRPGASVGSRDLRAPDALESALPRAALRAPLQRQEGPGRRPGPGRLHARPLPR